MIPLRDNVRSRSFPLVNYLIIAANAAAFFYQLKLANQGILEEWILRHAVVPRMVFESPLAVVWLSFLSSLFLHGGWFHILGNMLYLYIFGDNVEDRLGHVRYLFFYITCGVAASLTQVFMTPQSVLPMVGASGAIAGVLGAYFLYYPRARVATLIPLGVFSRVIEIPAFFFLGFWFLLQTFSGTSAHVMARASGQEVGGVAWWAHAGGFVAGMLMAMISSFFSKRP